MNGLADMRHTSGDSESFLLSPQVSEEWPDWSEPGEPESRTVHTPAWPPGPARPPLTALKEEETWDGLTHSSLGHAVSPGGGITGTPGDKAIPTSLPLTEAAQPLASSQPHKTSPVPDQPPPPQVSSRERHPKIPSELGLGEEFTIQVKKKLAQDPELDWFADMIPEIKPSGAILVLPELRTETGIPTMDGVSPGMQFSSKFAAAEMTEVRISFVVPAALSPRSRHPAVFPPREGTPVPSQSHLLFITMFPSPEKRSGVAQCSWRL